MCLPTKCFGRVSGERYTQIFDGFWKLGDWNSQNSYLCGSIKISKVQRRYKRKDTSTPSRRNFSRQFYVNEDGASVRMCKKAFLAIHGVSNGRLSRALKSFQAKSSPQTDKRGNHVPKNKTPVDVLRFVRAYIESFPTEKSHYSRNENPDKKYLPPDLSIRKMYELYTEKCIQEWKQQVKENVYRTVFNNEYNFSFRAPRSDTCNTCDKLHVSIKAETDVQKRCAMEAQLELHHRRAKSGYDALKSDLERARQDSNVCVLSFDLQQVLPCPRLSTNVVFYKRQLSVYNLGIHEASTNKGFMHIWHEGDGGRGSEDIANCLFNFVNEEKSEETRHVVAFSNTFEGQNRNFKVASMWLYCVHRGDADVVDHKFMYSGHSFLPND